MGFIKLQDVLKQCKQEDVIEFLDDPNLAIHFSQFGEDIVITELLLRRKPKGFYVDVGAHHPERFSNTRLLSLVGWTGVNIDAHKESIDLFKHRR